MVKQKSDIDTAQSAVSGFGQNLLNSRTVTVSQSDVSAMKNGMHLANNICKTAKNLNAKVTQISKAIPAYAKKVALNDKKDAINFKANPLDPIF